nr:polycystin-2-like [Onthophagus taurus]
MSILWIIFIWEFLLITLIKIANLKRKEIKKWYFYNRIISEGEQQRAMISRIFDDISNLRPYLLHLYKPLGVDVITFKRCFIARLTTIENSFRYILFLITCVFLLHLIITSNRNDLIQKHNEHLTSLINNNNGRNFLDINTLKDFQSYIYVLMNTLQSKIWYGEFEVVDNHLITDFNTKYLGSPTIRVIIVRGRKASNVSKKFNVTKIYPEYSIYFEKIKNLNQSNSSYFFSNDSKRKSYSGDLNTYPGGGFMTSLNVNETDTNLIKQKGKEWWMESFTRAIFIEFFTYNNNVNLFSDIKIIIERSPTGLTIPSIRIISNSLNYREVKQILFMKISRFA